MLGAQRGGLHTVRQRDLRVPVLHALLADGFEHVVPPRQRRVLRRLEQLLHDRLALQPGDRLLEDHPLQLKELHRAVHVADSAEAQRGAAQAVGQVGGEPLRVVHRVVEQREEAHQGVLILLLSVEAVAALDDLLRGAEGDVALLLRDALPEPLVAEKPRHRAADGRVGVAGVAQRVGAGVPRVRIVRVETDGLRDALCAGARVAVAAVGVRQLCAKRPEDHEEQQATDHERDGGALNQSDEIVVAHRLPQLPRRVEHAEAEPARIVQLNAPHHFDTRGQ
mmetsp:Transcript_24056/g.74488  ORF Transcript_24056/g.74488 Transcript_24056/m.74488 type:complete len:280 (-) Transcript_24056:32-871(-)